MNLETIGWIGSVAFAICSLPQAIKSIREKNSNGVAMGSLILWLIGEICTLIYVFPTGSKPLIFNYVLNLIFILIIFYYKIRK